MLLNGVKKEIEFDEMSLKHPYVTAATNTVAALTGLPLDRAQRYGYRCGGYC